MVQLWSPRPPIVMDCGTGFTKMGLAGDVEPTFILPTAIATRNPPASTSGRPLSGLEDLDYHIGDAALAHSHTHTVNYPIRHGTVNSWDHMEKYWGQAIHRYLRCNPEDHHFILTEPPLNPPENREYAAEVMFETYNISGLYIGVQAVLALYAGFAAAAKKRKVGHASLSGTVIDSGDGVTHVIPVSDGYVIGSSIKSIPIAGKDITRFIQQLMRERGEHVPAEVLLQVAQQVKEQHCYTCSDMAKEFAKHDAQREKYVKAYQGVHPATGRPFSCDIGYERFLGPEVFFSPEICSSEYTTPLPMAVDQVVQSCPIDTRRPLYSNIVLSGGSTMFKDFGRRVQRDVKRLVDARTQQGAQEVEVNVLSHPMQRYAVWFGGSVLGMMPDFPSVCQTKAEYEEYGPSIFRASRVFKEL